MKRYHFVLIFLFLVSISFCQNLSAFYHPEMGRFVSRDPIEYDEGNDISLYRYIDNSAPNYLDTTGEKKTKSGPREKYDPHKPGIKKQGRELKSKKRKQDNFIQRNQPKPLKHHTPGKGHRKKKSFTEPKTIQVIGLSGCELACAKTYNDCLSKMTKDYESCLENSYSCYEEIYNENINYCDKMWYYDATECGAKYITCGLSCLLPFSWR